jgi:uncharacterized protein
MTRIIAIVLIATTLFSCGSDFKKDVEIIDSPELNIDTTFREEPIFDSLKAYEYGADDYGMKMYVMAFLKRGPNRDRDSTEAFNLQRAHLDNINRLVEEGKMVLAGPFGGDGDLRGIYIFNVATVEEAKALTETDPAIKAGSLVMELIPWYGSAAVVGIVDEHAKIAKINI